MPRDEVDQRAHLWLRGRIGARAMLLVLLPPERRKVAVEVQTLFRRLNRDLHAVEVAQLALWQHAVILSARLVWLAAHQQARLLRADFPGAVGIGDAHGQDTTVAVNVFGQQAVYVLFIVGVGARAGADELRRIGQRPFRAIGIDARADIEGAGIEAAGDVVVVAIAAGQRVEQIETRAGRRDLGRVDVAVHPQRGLL